MTFAKFEKRFYKIIDIPVVCVMLVNVCGDRAQVPRSLVFQLVVLLLGAGLPAARRDSFRFGLFAILLALVDLLFPDLLLLDFRLFCRSFLFCLLSLVLGSLLLLLLFLLRFCFRLGDSHLII